MRWLGDDIYELSTGKTFYAHNGIIGIDWNFELFEGYDGGINFPMPDWWSVEEKQSADSTFLTNDEAKELADYMIERWQAFKDNIAK